MKLLIVEDEEHFIHTLRRVIETNELGIENIIEVRDGLTAAELVRVEQPDIILTDMNMPYLDGAGFLDRCRQMRFGGEIIVISGHDDFRYTRSAIRADVLDYILKPIDPDEINRILKRAVERIRCRVMTDQEVKPVQDAGIESRIKTFLEQHYTEPISLDLVAKKFYLSKEIILKLFKQKYACGVYEYVLKLRMERARYLVENTDNQVLQIAGEVGFNDSNYFSKAFKKYFGCSPKTMRKAHREGLNAPTHP